MSVLEPGYGRIVELGNCSSYYMESATSSWFKQEQTTVVVVAFANVVLDRDPPWLPWPQDFDTRDSSVCGRQ